MKKLIGAATLAMALAACGETAPDEATDTAAREWPGVPEEQAAMIREAGQVIDPASFDIFAPLVDAPPYDDVTMTENVAYGDDPAQQLDLYTFNAAEEGISRPVLLYVHGGGFVGGSKQGAYYPQSATAWAARNGMVGVNIDYRLAPDNPYPAASADLASAIAWVRANIAQHGGDPDHIILWGHSAGANVVADYVATDSIHGEEFVGVQGAVLMSPAYALEQGEDPHPYYGEDASLLTAAPSIERLGATSLPLMIAWAEYDPQLFHDFAEAAEASLCAEGAAANCPTMLYLKDHNHMTEGASIGSVDESFSGPFTEWMGSL
ncbi:alpha/beta hydrolase [Alteraurantiacibacter aquimixticola]|uniref:Alpha/beta hydrolase n=1 Tax=Alteraurantiacibacter aquimixticola TaxID=2489173 RepID=A0A4T3F1U6_9SPHN|nr:alpha/beta hydrolase [Alteraurantiacibacter aquimixticola]TIX51058.1 alpha/beta hydrolase [Alteraurantiacibacter aquimixticola]